MQWGCAFVRGLPASVRRHIQSVSRMDSLPLEGLLVRTRAIMKEESEEELMVAAARSTQSKHVLSTVGPSAKIKCYICNGTNHLAGDYP